MSETVDRELVIVACGGGGHKIAMGLLDTLREKNSPILNMFKVLYLDTSTVASSKTNGDDKDVKFYHIGTDKKLGNSVDGTGGNRADNLIGIKNDMEKFINEEQIITNTDGKFYIVLSTLSGGSGSVISTVLLKQLLIHEIPTIPILITDTSNKRYTDNSLNAISTLINMCVKEELTLPILVVDNNTGTVEDITIANETCYNKIEEFALIISDTQDTMDKADLKAGLVISKNTGIKVEPGIVELQSHRNGVSLVDGSKHLSIRTTTIHGFDIESVAGEKIDIIEIKPSSYNFLSFKSSFIVDAAVASKVYSMCPVSFTITDNSISKKIGVITNKKVIWDELDAVKRVDIDIVKHDIEI